MSAASINAALSPFPAERTGQMSGVAQQKAPPIAQALNGTLVHLEIGNPSEIAQPHVDADPGIEQRAQLGRRRKLAPSISLVAIDKNKPAIVRQRREQPEPSRPHDDAAAFGRAGKAKFHVGDNISTAIGLSLEMLLHRMARHAMATACTQHVSRRDDLRSAAGIERHAQPGRIIFDRPHIGAEFDLKAKALQMFAQDCLGAPLRKAALKLILAANIREVRRPDLPQTRTQDLNVPDAHARAKERFDQAAPVKNLQHRRLERGPARLAMRREPALHDARLDAMAKKFAGREQSGRTSPDDQDGRAGAAAPC